MTTPRQHTIGALLKWHRDAMGLTQKELAKRSCVSVRTIIKLERDESRPYHDTVGRLADALALSPRDQVLFVAAAHHWDAPPPDALAAAWPHTLPVPPTPLVGRDAEVAAAMALLWQEEVRLATFMGKGGVGKTHLAIQVTALLAERFAAGVFFVPLTPVREPHLVIAAIARALGVREGGDRPLAESVAADVGDRQVLLLLDNFEHVAPAAPTVATLLAACPRLKVLVTSQKPLRLRGEHRFLVPSLAWPDPHHLPSLTDLKGYAAIALFVQRSRAIAPTFKLTLATARAVADICARLDGLPLAIELAAARVDVLSPQDLLVQLTRQPLQVLADGAVDLPKRQQAMSDTLAWSYNLLTPREQALFRHLAVFAGGGTLDATEAVCAWEGEPKRAIPACLESLVDHSLLRQDPGPAEGGGEPRFALLEIVRQYAEEQLIAVGEAERARDRHRDWCVELAEQAEPELTGPDQAPWLARLEIEHDNLRAALRWTLERGNAAVGLRLAAALWRFWLIHGHLSEGREWFKRLLESTKGGAAHDATASMQGQWACQAKALRGAGGLAYEQGDYEDARGLYTAALALYQELDDMKGIAALLNNLGIIEDTQAHYERATDLYQQSLSLKRELDDRWGMTTSLGNLGRLALQHGQFDRAVTLYEESLALSRELGDTGSVALSLNNLGEVLLLQGEYERAAALLEESVTLAREVGDKRGLAFALNNLGEVAFRQGEHERARTFFEESLRLRRDLENKEGIAVSLSGLGDVARARGEHGRAARLYLESLSLLQASSDTALIAPILEQVAAFVGVARGPALTADTVTSIRAAQFFGAASYLRDTLTAPLPPASRVAYERDVDTARRAVGDDAFARAWAEGQTLPLEQVIAEAIRALRKSVVAKDT